LDKQLMRVENQISGEQTATNCPHLHKSFFGEKLKWTGKILDYVEWIYGLYVMLNRKGDKVTLESLLDIFGSIFGIKIKQVSAYFTAIKKRSKGDRTSFLDKQKDTLKRRMEKSDNTPSKK
jgi:hypothetical protein